jgi:hypothetical protein
VCKKLGWSFFELYNLPQLLYEEIISISHIEEQFEGGDTRALESELKTVRSSIKSKIK